MIVESHKVVYIEFSGDGDREGHYHLDDHGLVGRFLNWQQEHKIFPALMGTICGGGRYSGAFYEADAEKVLAWFRENGVETPETFTEQTLE